jgi:DNA-directed RNA polymerase subunit N (RpoN/RPB10)
MRFSCGQRERRREAFWSAMQIDERRCVACGSGLGKRWCARYCSAASGRLLPRAPGTLLTALGQERISKRVEEW